MTPSINFLKLISIFTFTLAILFVPSSNGNQEQVESAVNEQYDINVQKLEFSPIRTDSPKQTYETFIYLMNRLDNIVASYGVDSASDDAKAYTEILLVFEQANALIEQTELVNTRRNTNYKTVSYLFDILKRIELPNPDDIPDMEDESETNDSWRIPGTPVRIVKVMEGSRMGEYLFDENVHWNAPRFFNGISHLPLHSKASIESWTKTLPQISGPKIPADLIISIPEILKELWFDTPVWKVLLSLTLISFSAALSLLLYWLLNRNIASYSVKGAIRSVLGVLIVLIVFAWLKPFIVFQLNLSGDFLFLINNTFTTISYLAKAWLFWWAVQLIFLQIVSSRAFDSAEIEYPLILVVGKIIAFIGVLIIITSGIQALGLPLVSFVASLGVGGIAVALSIRPTLENMIGGLILYLDKPVRIGDYCTFGDKVGVVENIGIRTIKIRGLDRTLISIPNAAFADMELVNWAQCDKMMIRSTIPLKFKTSPDELRYLLVRMREMCHAHPKIDSETIRIRLVGFGKSSLDVEIRVYALTHEWNEFFSIREDIFLRIKDLISESGVSFAMPTQTLQMAPREEVDKERANAASKTVKSWRKNRKLPFPGLSSERIEELKGTLDWPPRGSFDSTESLEAQEPAEPLSTANIDSNEPNDSNEPIDSNEPSDSNETSSVKNTGEISKSK